MGAHAPREAGVLSARNRISIAILALGGQGGGVLTQWIARLGGQTGYRSQATSIPGVAQRTGATIYYVELIPWGLSDPEPILALSPAVGDVDVVLAFELMEAGRAMIRGFVSPDRTTLIGSTHRVYALSEKSARGNGIANSDAVLSAARQRARRFVAFDMSAVAEQAGCAISAVVFGALAGSGVLPFPVADYIEVIRAEGKSVDANLEGFHAGLTGSRKPDRGPSRQSAPVPAPTTDSGWALQARIVAELPPSSYNMAVEGVRRLVDYQDYAYANLYLDRLAHLRTVDSERAGWKLTDEAVRYLALWMAYDDTIRVADLKVRETRVQRVRKEVGAHDHQLIGITEFMHPRLRELCDTLPRAAGEWLLHSPLAARLLQRFFSKGRCIETTSLAGFLTLSLLASLRRWRRSTLRYAHQQRLIENWLDLARAAAAADMETAVEIIRCQRLIKGYGETYDNGLTTFNQIMDACREMKDAPGTAAKIRGLRESALASA
ncbi:MAG: indolepyruvate oxidoreductase subunit beta family protein [Proteobacteria bacterium]|nr:indolepyruvate oxidoreductase subunit beta family protein [Pseudomonadota bacterium]